MAAAKEQKWHQLMLAEARKVVRVAPKTCIAVQENAVGLAVAVAEALGQDLRRARGRIPMHTGLVRELSLQNRRPTPGGSIAPLPLYGKSSGQRGWDRRNPQAPRGPRASLSPKAIELHPHALHLSTR